MQVINVRNAALAAAALILGGCGFFGSKMGVYPTVEIDSGRLQGAVEDGVPVFKGVPYAAAPIGDLRWRPPQPAEPWRKLRKATRYTPHCAQFNSPQLWFELERVSEDCLTLNVWTPVEHRDRRAPVMVWIHGGGFVNGSGNIERLNSAEFVKQGVVLVTINYRLGVFGFLTHPALSADNPDDPVGNYGLQDVVASLKWVQRNIGEFGGDPDRVTIFGESAGASIVNMLMVMPSAEGLFQRAIAQSASSGLAPEPYPDRRAGFLQPTYETGAEFVSRLTFNKEGTIPADEELAAALRDQSTAELLDALKNTDRFTPVIDGEVLPEQLGVRFANGDMHRVPYMNGSVSWEASLGREIGGGFSPESSARLVPAADKERLYPGLEGEALEDEIFADLIVNSGTRYVADQLVKYDVPVHSFYMSYVAEARRDSQPGVAHTDDIAFVLQTLDSEPLEYVSTRDREISRLMSEYWVRFARKADPNVFDLPEWPRYTGENGPILEIGDEIAVRDPLFDERMEFFISRGMDFLTRAARPQEPAESTADD